jgi:hypothetical protein
VNDIALSYELLQIIFAPKSATVILCLGGDVDVSVGFQDMAPSGSGSLMAVDTPAGPGPRDDVTESANESASAVTRTRAKTKKSKKRLDAECMGVQLKLVHGDGLYFRDGGTKVRCEVSEADVRFSKTRFYFLRPRSNSKVL